MKKKFLSMITAIVLLLSLLPQGILTVSAAITATQPTVGDGTANHPYQVGTAAELYWFADYVNNGNISANAVLTADITVNTGVLTEKGYLNSSNEDNFTSWTPIGNNSNPYTGTFDGQGHTVSGLYFYDNKVSVGLFGYVGSGGRVSGVGVVDFYFSGDDEIGGVCGRNFGTIESCYNAGLLSSRYSNTYIGGVCGVNSDTGTIENCYNAGTRSWVCGANYGTIENCYNAGNALDVCGSSNKAIKNCYYLNTTGNDRYAKAKTAEAFASGEVAYLLQNGQEPDENGNIPEVWGQTIGTDTYPVLGGAKVYQVVAYAGCEGNPGNESTAYSNTDAPVYGDDHSFDSNGFCEGGDGGCQPAILTTDKYNIDGVEGFDNVYEISNAGQLYWFAQQINGGTTDINAVLTENIVVNTGVLKSDGTLVGDVSGFTSWTPIGNNSNQYTGTFDGQGHTVSGLYFTNAETYNVGLFGCVGSNETNKGSVSNVGVADSYFNGYLKVGGVCGENYGTITDCYSTAAVIGAFQVGGVCGENYGAITDCYNTGTVSGKTYVGGVCGYNNDRIANSYNIGIVSGNSGVGGVSGGSGGTIENCYSTAAVSGAEQVGGVCGDHYGAIAFCYNTGTVSGKISVGGVCGFYNSAATIIENCYFDSEKYNGAAVGTTASDKVVTNVEGKTKAQFNSGEVAYLLQSGQKADENGNIPEVWGQNIGTDNSPVLGGAKVYQVVAYAGCECKPGNESTAYSNTNATVYGDHSFDSNGFCKGGGYQPAEWDETNNRYEIGNAGQLYWFAQQVNGGTADINAVLTADIDLSGTGDWTPIGNADNKYTGTFDGLNHTVKDMSITKQGNNSGLFGYTDHAAIKNIIITGEITITAKSYTEGYGSIVGRADNNTTVTNCHSSVNITIDSTMESTAGSCIGHIGGIIGKMHYADSPISNCSYSGTIELKDKPINVAAGIVGYATYSIVPITNCSFTGKINSTYTGTGEKIIGGIFGYTRTSNDVKVTNCLSAGTITISGDTSKTGILIGMINGGYGKNEVKNNYYISSSLNVIGSKSGIPTTAPATLCTEEQLASGKVAYLLNGSTSEGTLAWGQDLSTADSYPVLTSDNAKKVLKVEFKILGADGEYTLYADKYGNYDKALSDFPEEITGTIWVDGVNQFTASSRVTEDKTVYPVGYSVKYNDDGKVVISAPKPGNYKIIIASYSGLSLLKVQFADITLESGVDSYEITDLNGFDTTGADTVKVFFWDTEMRPQCDAAVKTLS